MIQFLIQILSGLRILDREIEERRLEVLRPNHIAHVIGTNERIAKIILEAGVRFHHFDFRYLVYNSNKTSVVGTFHFKDEIPEQMTDDSSEESELNGPYFVTSKHIEKVYVPRTQ